MKYKADFLKNIYYFYLKTSLLIQMTGSYVCACNEIYCLNFDRVLQSYFSQIAIRYASTMCTVP